MIKEIIILSCLLTSAFLLYLSFANFSSDSNHGEGINRLRSDSSYIELGHISEDYNKNQITAIGLITAQTCSSCITELMEYSDQISSINAQFFDNEKIDKLFLVMSSNSASAERFKSIHNLKEKVVFLETGSELANKLYHWDKEKTGNQWIFVDNTSSRISSRILVLSELTPISFKKNLLNQAIFTE